MIARNAKVTVGNAIALWAMLLEDASHPEHRGICIRGEDFYGAILDLEFEEVAAILSAMEQLKMISVGHGDITITNWEKRQFETDSKDRTNAERQRRFKEKRKQNGQKTIGNGKVTDKKHQNTDTDTDIPKEDKSSLGLGEVSPATPPPIESKEKKPRASRLQPDFTPPDTWLEFAVSKSLTEAEAGQEWGKFRDHHLSRGTLLADWNAGWRTWVRKAVEFKAERQQREARMR